ncbi:autotransporter assembly complex protein TamA [Ovoidimarina sediminis]|uniref:autotransporter assembly complex protein TamA n=1 Tax=Ovoidimarina sediminis TaxID=3079856 RepID=UPI0029098D45|nr:autotransporter assembly complex family protein [Rhodophyticola sp. MJ-SS7]MDU8942627.1 autotransporter assembly complex family protein [Rhodophyticola sp. MJ-SS7]
MTVRQICAGAIFAAALGMGAAGPSAALEPVRIFAPGASRDLASALEQSSLVVAAWRDGVTAAPDLLAAARADYPRFVGALYSEGYYGGTVSILIDGQEAADISGLNAPTRIDRIVVRVTPGPLFRFGQTRVAPAGGFRDMPEEFRPGAPARSELIQEAVTETITAWRDIGHAKADVAAQRLVADHDRARLDADVEIDPGPRLRFGDLRIEKQSRMSERRIRKIAGLPTGEVFSPADLDRTARRLRDTGVFSTVALREAERPNPDGTLDITARIVDQKPRRFGVGAEYATDEGLSLSGFWLHRNLRGEGERLRIGGEVSGISGETGGEDYELTFDLTRPATLDALTDAYLSARLAQENEEDFLQKGGSLELGFIRRQTDDLTLQAGIGYSYADVSDDLGEETYEHLYFPIGATLDRREDLLDTTDGYYADLQVTPYFGLGGSESGTRITGDIRAYEEFGATKGTVFAARVQFGSITGASLTGLPNDLRFYSGGGDTVRGHSYQSLGVDLAPGVTTGGRSFLGLQTELRQEVRENIWIVGFADWGMIGADSVPGVDGDSHAGAGIGLRYNTGIGPIRVDVGVPVSGEDDGSSFQIYIGIGQAF